MRADARAFGGSLGRPISRAPVRVAVSAATRGVRGVVR
jgi:hypothetical protein